MTHLLDLLEDASGDSQVTFVSDQVTRTSSGSLWSDAQRAARWFDSCASDVVAMALVSTPECVSSLIGAWMAGVTVASVPMPARGLRSEDYKHQLNRIMRAVGATQLLTHERLAPMAQALGIKGVVGFAEIRRGSRKSTHIAETPGEFIQFTSGSTADPKGVILTLDAIAANIESTLARVEPVPGDVTCSWLPLSHDMGLIGMLLAPYVAAGPKWANGEFRIILIDPERFLRRPRIWMELCSAERASFTTAPNFALRIAERSASGPQLDLSRVRVFITGAESVQGSALRSFAATFASAGFDAASFCPAYGLAEASLAVSIVPPEEAWRSICVDAKALSDGRWEPADGENAVELVSTGPPLECVEVRMVASEAPDLAEVQVRGPAVCSGYVGSERRAADAWFATGDLGRIEDREIYIGGRLDDMICVRGQNLRSSWLEAIVSEHPSVRPGNTIAVRTPRGEYAIVAEPRNMSQAESLAVACKELRVELTQRTGISPESITFVERGSLPKTPSGKPQRWVIARALEMDTLALIMRL